jgi:DNA topoisomerase I
MAKYLVVVESPTKIKSLKKYLGKDYEVLASKGHVKDLPGRSLGVDVDNSFLPKYVTIPGKEKILREITKAALIAEKIFLAPDPDREGEAIAWHIAQEIRKKDTVIERVLINEITKKGIREAIDNPVFLDNHKFEAQQARRILDRLVGYQISPLLWKKVKRGLSAGRVQSVAVRLICEREAEIRAFKPEEYWTVDIGLDAKSPPEIKSRLVSVDGNKIGKDTKIQTGDEAESIKNRIEAKEITVAKIKKRERKKNPVPPFTTSKLQQEAFRKLGFNVKRTMSVAQSLYEGIDVEGEGPVGLITYMRTDSTRMSEDFLKDTRGYIEKKYGGDYLPAKANEYKTKKSSQDAHEAIRPTLLEFPPEKIEKVLSKDQMNLYKLIWNRSLACQMMPAVYDQMSVDFDADEGNVGLRASGSRLIFKGFLEVYEEGKDEVRKRADTVDDDDASGNEVLPVLEEGEVVSLKKVDLLQHFTQPPPRFNESSMVKELDEKGIGRPSTYATILSTIVDRGYVKKNDNRYEPSILGEKVNELLVESFPDILNVKFTAGMEDNLDKIEEGKSDWQKILSDFYAPFSERVKSAETTMKNVKASSEPTDVTCDVCEEGKMAIKWSSRGEFLGCGAYPMCRNTREFTRNEEGKIIVTMPKYTGDKCPRCKKDMILKSGRFGDYIACMDYPSCPTVKSLKADVECPEDDCSGGLVARRTKTGKNFWGCTNYPGCQYALWNRPVKKVCGNCEFPILGEKVTKKDGARLVCPSCKAENVGDVPGEGETSSNEESPAK